ncbi:hypothetical protein [Roseibium sp.]|uniref:hypothetical protein n=1 Tax=Roseibium sp. TaxID=1936156 RepID=UPI003BAC9828
MQNIFLNRKFQVVSVILFFGFLSYATKYRPLEHYNIRSKPYTLFQGWIDAYLVSWMGVNLASLTLIGMGLGILLLVWIKERTAVRKQPSRLSVPPQYGQQGTDAHARKSSFGKR